MERYGGRDRREKNDSTYIATWLRHKLLQFVDQTTYFFRIFLDTAQFFLVEIWCDLLTENYLWDHIADVGRAGSSFWNQREKDLCWSLIWILLIPSENWHIYSNVCSFDDIFNLNMDII